MQIDPQPCWYAAWLAVPAVACWLGTTGSFIFEKVTSLSVDVGEAPRDATTRSDRIEATRCADVKTVFAQCMSARGLRFLLADAPARTRVPHRRFALVLHAQ